MLFELEETEERKYRVTQVQLIGSRSMLTAKLDTQLSHDTSVEIFCLPNEMDVHFPILEVGTIKSR